MSKEVTNPNVRHYSSEDVVRLKELVSEGVRVNQEIDDLRGGLNDTVKEVAEEIGIAPGQLKKVIKIAHKNNLIEERENFEEIEDILNTIGRS